jgi:hypothetical protein
VTRKDTQRASTRRESSERRRSVIPAMMAYPRTMMALLTTARARIMLASLGMKMKVMERMMTPMMGKTRIRMTMRWRRTRTMMRWERRRRMA